MFHIINKYFGINKKNIVEILVKFKIDIYISLNMNKRNIIIKLINLYKNNNNSFPIQTENYKSLNKFTYDELVYMIKKYKIKIPYYNNITKKELINQILKNCLKDCLKDYLRIV